MIDEIDRRMIKLLQKDGRLSHADIARQLNIAPSTAFRRVKRLLEENIIKIMAIPEPTRLGYQAMAVICLDVETAKIDDVCAHLAADPNVCFLGTTFGRYDVFLSVYFTSSDALAEFVKGKLSTIDGVRQVETFYVAELKKRTFGAITRTGSLVRP